MNTFGKIDPKDYTIEKFNASAPINWILASSSLGVKITYPLELDSAITINRASNSKPAIAVDENNSAINIDTGIYEYVLYKSVKHTFYDNRVFYSGSTMIMESLAPLPDKFFVVSVGQDFYGSTIKKSSFELSIDSITIKVQDDGYGNLYVSQSGVGYYVGNIFYDYGIAVIKQNTASLASYVGQEGISIINGSDVEINYNSDVEITRHQISVKLNPTDFNFPLLNKSIERTFTPNPYFTQSYGEFTSSMAEQNIQPISDNTWSILKLIQGNVIKPYITTIGLYTDQYELVAVGKLSRPIQRTFDIPQIFIVRFDT